MEMKMKAHDYINATRAYLCYLEKHISNVEKAWRLNKAKLANLDILLALGNREFLDIQIAYHDLSKFSAEEFTQYRKRFYPVQGCLSEHGTSFNKAWANHKLENEHHWESINYSSSQQQWKLNIIHMVIDWTAMGYVFGDTAKAYYEANKDRIEFPSYVVEFLYEVFTLLETK